MMIATALLAFAGLDVVFVEPSDTPAAALTFAVLSYMILLLLSGSTGALETSRKDLPHFLALSWGRGGLGSW